MEGGDGGAGGMAAVVVPGEVGVPAEPGGELVVVGPGTGAGGAVQAAAAASPAAIPASCSMRRRGKDDWSISRS
ncbi:hypothetical protein [Arthrobacter globiformis]|uniref:hypothetical protein n=1 Tax=Arthrobacter globiformis TaxID=1665 RepID=UPI0027D8FCE6|nr:hypothetical protein [Arthrobacter globiformis]